MMEKMACSLLAGMPVIEKPGTPTALVAWRIAQIVVERKILPEGVYQFVCGSLGDMLDHMGAQDVLAFTGSSATGAKLRGNQNLVQVALDAGPVRALGIGELGLPDHMQGSTLGVVQGSVALGCIHRNRTAHSVHHIRHPRP
jgi:oxepin-CoA hydrolase/3-oxo-5,6-dehydrosuberyl-CoA semialdehyde dehydrogenase